MPKMRLVQVLALLAASAAAIDDLGPCQSRCYDLTADLVGCEADDYACHCEAWDSRFSSQMSSCMIEGCAFGDEGPTIDATELKGKVCELAGQSPDESTPSQDTPTGEPTSAGTPSETARGTTSNSQDAGETAEPTPGAPDETESDAPEPTGDADSGDDDEGGDDDDGGDESGARALNVLDIPIIVALAYLVL